MSHKRHKQEPNTNHSTHVGRMWAACRAHVGRMWAAFGRGLVKVVAAICRRTEEPYKRFYNRKKKKKSKRPGE